VNGPLAGERTRRARNSEARYDALSRYYDTLVDPVQGRFRRQGIDCLGVSSDDRVLDVGCGTGRGIATLQNAVGPGGRVVGIDVAEGMCRRTRDRVDDDVPTAVVRGDALELPFGIDGFDAVLVSLTLELFAGDDRTVVLGEIRRVLAPGGRICVVAPSTASMGFIPALYERLNDAFPGVVDSRPLDVRGVLAESGFEVVQSRIGRAVVVPVELVVARHEGSTRDRDS